MVSHKMRKAVKHGTVRVLSLITHVDMALLCAQTVKPVQPNYVPVGVYGPCLIVS